jgi:hypothetical protein
MTAIVAGTVVSVVVTIASMWMSGEEKLSPTSVSIDATEVSIDVTESEVFLDPRGPERGPSPLEWDVIRTYKAIESMTATAPSMEIVDETLDQLRTYANDHPENPYLQELYLKGLRVAGYYAVAEDDDVRAAVLEARFTEHAARFMGYDAVVLEYGRLIVQRLDQSCDETVAHMRELRVLADRFRGGEEIEGIIRYGLAAAADRCGQRVSSH